MPTISIAMATYNGGKFLGQQLETIERQTCRPDELIITDDCSQDDTVKIAEDFARRAQFSVQVIRNPENLGFNGNFANALSRCTGDFVFVSDQDDIWYPEKLQRCVAELSRHPEAVCLIHDERIMGDNGEMFDRTYFDNQRALHYGSREMVSGNCMAFRRPFLQWLLPFPEGINYDYWIGWLSDALKARIVLDEPLQTYRRHGSNASEPVLAERRPSRFSAFTRTGLIDQRPMWRETIKQHDMLLDRLNERRVSIDSELGAGRVSAAVEDLRAQNAALHRRVDVMSKPPIRRRLTVLGAWQRGFYGQFSGAKSAVRDLLQP